MEEEYFTFKDQEEENTEKYLDLKEQAKSNFIK